MKSLKLEICVYNTASCLAALKGNADRVELCASMPEGGITPSLALIEQAQEILTATDNPKQLDVMVMIRPRGGDFLYDDWEFKQMVRDVEICRKAGVAGVVFGILTNDGNIDKKRNSILLDVAGDMQTCFHRAIDMSSNYVKAAEDIVNLGFSRILTSGGMNKAADGIENIKKISSLFSDKIDIMAGSGVNPDNMKTIYEEARPSSFHFSAKKIVSGGMLFRNPNVSMGVFGNVSEYDLAVSDEYEIRRAKNVIMGLERQ